MVQILQMLKRRQLMKNMAVQEVFEQGQYERTTTSSPQVVQ